LEKDRIPCLKIRNGAISLASINCNAFGCGIVPPWDYFSPVVDWDFSGLGLK